MEVYTNAMLVKELITNQTEIGVCPLNQHVPESKEVDLFLFDDHLLQFMHLLVMPALINRIMEKT